MGALWAFAAAWLQVRFDVPLLITTLLLNYVAALLGAYLVSYPLRDLGGSAALAQRLVGMLPDAAARTVMRKAGVDRLQALTRSIETVCRGGTISIVGVYGGAADPLNMLQLFDKGVKLAMGQAHVKRWIDDLMRLVCDDEDPLGVEDLCTHRLPLEEAPQGYEIFQKKQDGAIKVVLQP